MAIFITTALRLSRQCFGVNNWTIGHDLGRPLQVNFELTSEQRQMKELAREIGKRYQPYVLEWDRDGVPPEMDQEMIGALRDHDLLGMVLPEEYGGQGRPFLDMILVLEELARFAPPLAAY